MNTRIHESERKIQQKVKTVASQATISPVMETLLRLGFIVRGLIYGVMGLLAFQVVLGRGGKLTDPQGAIAAIGNTTFGGILLYGILVGLAAYGLWGLIRAIFDPLHKGTDAKGSVERIGFAISGFSYLGLGFATYNLIQGRASAAQNGAQSAQLQHTAGAILSKPWGGWVVGFAAILMIIAGYLEMKKGFDHGFHQQFNSYALTNDQRKIITRIGRFGEFARGVVYTLIGLFLLVAAYTNNPSKAQGIDGVFSSLLQQPFGPWLLGIVALGLIAFGFYSMMSGVLLRLKRGAPHA